ncbi:xanthine dehydrogenase small subunit [Mixta theicola]|uniref:Xanthine dehydrogenase small subunit n=1 Tax=Mixta theicola TaxID=1458355 RepID=A0A2K1QDJ7_9GAMM|nr:xanthine dehydrogenase small subunit [Mixta theicola]PNS13109.1 xanthine dehydrogenase small subunit [Mixta theicola]GLR09378.1 xanthine dehydrogenase [Mixta theicola]
MIQFLLNQTRVSEHQIDANTTVLNYLRQQKGRRGTKEGCASGDCGACTVTLGSVVDGKMRYETVNSCLLPIGALDGKQLITVEDLRQGDRLHSVQQAMVNSHASQCGFCTPGFVMSLFVLQKNSCGWDRQQAESALAGNLCRCTGYRPIIEAARIACEQPEVDSFSQREQETVARLQALQQQSTGDVVTNNSRCVIPKTCAQLASFYLANPQAVLLAGGTDVALRITQQYQKLPLMIALEKVEELQHWQETPDAIVIGAAVPLSVCQQRLRSSIPEFSEMLQRFASLQIRNRGTLGGNIANASPIGDCSPMLLALEASLILQQGDRLRQLPLSQFFLGYRRTALETGEFIRAIHIPKVTLSPEFRAWKVSKRREDDISAVFAAFNIKHAGGVISGARLAFGGMAETPRRAAACEAALIGQPLSPATLENACRALEQDFQPLSDARASAAWRMQLAKNLLRRYFHQLNGELAVSEVSRYVS